MSKTSDTFVKEKICPKRKKLSFQFMLAFCVQILLVSLFIIGLWQGFLKDYLYKEALHTHGIIAEKIIQEIKNNLDVAQALSNIVGKSSHSASKDLATFKNFFPQISYLTQLEEKAVVSNALKNILPQILDNESSKSFVAGGGYWPEPYVFSKESKRNSFFWSRKNDSLLKFYDDYNDPKGNGYHQEEWYVPTKYQKPGKCYWSKSYVDPYSFVPMITCSTGIWGGSNGQFLGVATVDVMLDGLKNTLKESINSFKSHAFLLDRNKKFITVSNEVVYNKLLSSSNNQSWDFEEFAKDYPQYKAFFEIFKKLQSSVIKPDILKDFKISELAKSLQQECPQIAEEEALAIAIGLKTDANSEGYHKNPTDYINLDYDPILKDEAFVTLIFIPQVSWHLVIITSRSSFFERINFLTQKLSLSTTLLIIGLFCTIFLSIHMILVKPIKKMITSLREQSVLKGEHMVVLDERTPNELGEIAALYNKNTENLQKAKNDAMTANKTKTMFLCNMSHELRTPMHAILNYCSLGLKKITPQEDPKLYKYFNNIEASGKRLLVLLNDLLDLSKLEFGKMDLDLSKNHDLVQVIQNAIQEIENLGQAKNLSLKLLNENAHTILPFDYNRILQVLINFLSNGIKFSPLGSTVTIKIHKKGLYENEVVC
ncbi:MAG TPA: histidine kinase dimerization/phospho-acceptor domain-containing protein, partial [Alphaproteobacteria bacterium]|nr:histidine kinase dimerization/phospho-acceptor domain-containing protein [Alphaproteobacteria bacterium]